MNLSYVTTYESPKTQEQKYELMKFVYDNTDSFVMNTFGYLWETRDWWDKFPIQVARQAGNIIGLHAYTIGTKADRTIKTYYIAVHNNFRGYGIAKDMTLNMLRYNELFADTYYVNSVEGSDGVAFYTKLFKSSKRTANEFGSIDIEFWSPIHLLLK